MPGGDLRDALSQVLARIGRYRSLGINEQNTKASLIEPVLRALGWDLEDLDEVQRAYKPRSADNPVDYALLVLDRPRLFIEAKALGGDLTDRRWAHQIMAYAVVAGVEWVVLTNGDEYRIYNAHAPVPVEDKMFRVVRITDTEPSAEETLDLLSKALLQRKQIEALWSAHFVDRQIRPVIEGLFSPAPDSSLINLVRKRLPNLSPNDIRQGLYRLRIRLDTLPEPAPPEGSTADETSAVPAPEASAPAKEGVSIQDLIQAGLIRPPTALMKRYKGRDFIAQIESDGRVTFDGVTYNSLSEAAGSARRSVIGNSTGHRYPPTNGWQFWQITTDAGSVGYIDVLRERYAKGREP